MVINFATDNDFLKVTLYFVTIAIKLPQKCQYVFWRSLSIFHTKNISNCILKHNISLVEIKIGCFFLIFGSSTLLLDLQASHEKTVTEYMELFIKETNNVALAESKESAFQSYTKYIM